jgi:retinol dehydrogenase 12
MAGRVAVVTGATSGIGREIARGLARMGATTVVVGRGRERIQGTAQAIAQETQNPSVRPMEVGDLSERVQIFGLADRLLAELPHIHLLVNDAGAIFAKRATTSDGLERTFALNVLAPFVLTDLLGPRLKENAPARVVQIASAAHRRMHLDFEDLQLTRRYSGWRAYGRSKLALILLTREFARRWAGSGVTVNAVHPGFVRSGFAQNNPGLFAWLVRGAARIGGISPERGARTPLFAASDPRLATVSGAYISGRKVVAGSRESRDEAAAKRLFDACRELARRPD